MKLLVRFALATTAFAISVPASAAIVVNGSSGVAPTAGVPANQGTLLAIASSSLQSLTFATTFLQGVYRNDFGTLDFYYQVTRTGPGTLNNTGEIDKFTVSDFTGFALDGFATGATDPDGAGPFQGGANPNLADGTPSGSTTTFGRSIAGDILRVDFGLNGLSGTERSTTYIFRTNATAFDGLGTFGVLNGSSVQGLAFRPLSPQTFVPEPSAWMLMLLGFGGIGLTMRKRRRAPDRLTLPA